MLPAQYQALTASAGLVDFRDATQIALTGRDRRALLHRLSTNSVDRLRPGEGRETFITDGKGHVVAHVLAFAEEETLVLHGDPGQGPRIMAHLEYYIIHDDVQLHDRGGAWATALLAGPQAAVVLAAAVAIEPPGERLAHVTRADPPGPVSVGRFAVEGPVFLLSCPAQQADTVRQRLIDAGAAPCSRAAWEPLRIALGWPTYGRDITEANLPQEVGRNAQAISFNKGCYLGQETVARLDARGHVNRLLVGLRLSTTTAPPAGAELRLDGQTVGQITSAAPRPGHADTLALGYVRRGSHEAGTVLQSPAGPAKIVPLPMEF